MKNIFSCIVALILFLTAKGQTTKINNNDFLYGSNILDRVILVSRVDFSLWKIDQINNTPIKITEKAQFAYNTYIESLNGKAILTGKTSEYGDELWVSDFTEAGTIMLRDINPGSEGSSIKFIVEMNGLVFFSAITPDYGRELWVTDGTPAGTQLIKDISPGSGSSLISYAKYIKNNILYLSINDNIHGGELWRTDGTEQGTYIVKDINQGGAESNAFDINSELQTYYEVDNNIIFAANSGYKNGLGLWKSDGSEVGTNLIMNIHGSTYAETGLSFLTFKGKIFFGYREKLWVTDGTEQGTKIIKDIGPMFNNAVNSFCILKKAVVYDDKFIFLVESDSSSTKYEIWSSDGTENGTKLFFKPSGYIAEDIELLNDYIFYKNYNFNTFEKFVHTPTYKNLSFFYIEKEESTCELWITDGMTTSMVKDGFTFDFLNYLIEPFYRIDSSGLRISLNDGEHGSEPWYSDGTIDGTNIIKDINNGSAGSNPLFEFKYNTQQYVAADDGDNLNSYLDLYILGSTLPITLTSFTASLKNNNAQLSWETSTEYNVDRFIIQRSKDGINYSDIGSINPRNSGSQQQQYFYTDANVFAGVSTTFYYRLKTMDKDGKFSLSKIALLTKSGSNISIAVSPNPVKNLLTINYTAGNVQLNSMRITDANGHVIFVINNLPANSSGQQTVNVSKFAKGFYHVQLISGSEKKSVAFVKE